MGAMCCNCFTRQTQLPIRESKVQYPNLTPMESPHTQPIEMEKVNEPTLSRENLIELMERCEKEFTELLASKPSSMGFESNLFTEEFQVFSKDTQNGYIILSKWQIPFKAQDFVDFIRDFSIRCKWDQNIQEARKVTDLNENISVYHQVYKNVTMKTQKDILLVSKLSKVGGGSWIDVCSSIESNNVQSSSCRAKVKLGGFFVKPISDDCCEVTNVNDTEFQGTLPRSMLKKSSIKNLPAYVKTVINGMREHRREKTTTA